MNLKSREFRNGKTKWRFGAAVEGLQTVTEVFLVIYNRRVDSTVRFNRMGAQ